MDPTVRAGEKGREGECNYQLAKCIHIPSQKGGWRWGRTCRGRRGDVGGGEKRLAKEKESEAGGRKMERCGPRSGEGGGG